jgi:hypothetical protein
MGGDRKCKGSVVN